MNSKRFKFQAAKPEQLEERRVMTASPMDLDLSTVETQSVFVGDSISFNLFDVGGNIVEGEGEPGDRDLMMQLDPDSDETPSGASISFDGDFSWTPTAEQEGVHRIRVIAVDQGQPQMADVEDLFIEVKLGRPEVDLNGAEVEGTGHSTVFHVGRSPVSVVSDDLELADLNNESLMSASVSLTNPLDGEADQLLIDTTETAITAEYVDNQILLTGEDTLENYEKVLKTLTYSNSNAEADPTSRIIEISVNDGLYESEVATSVVAVNYAPDMLPIADQVVKAGESIQIDVPATDLNLDQSLAFLLDVESLEFVSLEQDPASRSATLTISPEIDQPFDTFEVRLMVLDQYGLADSQSFALTVEINEAPIISEIEDQTVAAGSEVQELPFSISDSETDADALQIEVASDNADLVPVENIQISGEGEQRSVKVSPVADQVGEANITLSVSDGVNSSSESFKVTVENSNSAPVAEDDSYSTAADTRLSISPIGVLTNDSHAEGDSLSIVELNGDASVIGSPVTLDSGAEITLNADGSFSYDPTGKFDELALGENIVDTIEYTVADTDGEVATATVEITVEGVNESPVAKADAFSTDANTALTISATGVLHNDSDIDNGDTMSVASIGGDAAMIGSEMELASGALLTINADGSLTYDPNGKFAELEGDQSATDIFSYDVADSQGAISTADVEITVTAPDDGQDQNAPPINAVPGQQEVDTDAQLAFSTDNQNAISVSDPDAGDEIIETSISVDSGSLTLSDGFTNTRHKMVGTISQINALLEGMLYSPEAGFEGLVSLTIVTDDLGHQGTGGAKSDSDTVLIAVNPVAQAPAENETPSDLIDSVLEDPLAVDELMADSILNA